MHSQRIVVSSTNKSDDRYTTTIVDQRVSSIVALKVQYGQRATVVD